MLVNGQSIGPYVIMEHLGSGGTSRVYRVLRDGQSLALKILREEHRHNPHVHARVFNEIVTLETLSIPGIVQVTDKGEYDGLPYLVMEYLPQPLTGRSLTWKESLDVGMTLAGILAALHKEGFVHRDIKPGNVLFTSRGELHLIDFSHADTEPLKAREICPVIPITTDSGTFLGTQAYAAPEQLTNSKAATDRADVYSLGILIFELLTHELPFRQQDPQALAYARLTQEAPRLSSRWPGGPPALSKLVQRMLMRQPAHRPSAAEVAAELREIRQSPRPAPGSGRWRVVALALLALSGLRPQPLSIDRPRALKTLYEAVQEAIDRGPTAGAIAPLALAAHLVDDPVTTEQDRAWHRNKTADVARGLGRLNEWVAGYKDAFQGFENGADTGDDEQARSRASSISNELADGLLHQGHAEEGLQSYQRSLGWQVRLAPGVSRHPGLALTYYRLGRYQAERGDIKEAQDNLTLAELALKEWKTDPYAPVYRARALEQLAGVLQQQEALGKARQAYAIAAEALGRHPTSRLHRLVYLRTAERLGDLSKDSKLLREALDGKEALWRADPDCGLCSHEWLESLVQHLRRVARDQEVLDKARMLLGDQQRRGQWRGDRHIKEWQEEIGVGEW